MGASGTKLVCTATTKEVAPADPDRMCGPLYRAADLEGELCEQFDPKVTTMWENMCKSCMSFGDRDMFGYRPVDAAGVAGDFVFRSYSDIFDEIKTFASGLRHLGLLKRDKLDRFEMLGLCGINRIEWIVAEYAALSQAAVTVPFYATYTSEQFSYALNLTGLATVVCMNQIAPVLVAAKQELPNLKLENLVVFDTIDEVQKTDLSKSGLKVYTYQQVLEAGKSNMISEFPGPKPSDVFSFVWTSGTTGFPKGALITHKNMIANLTAFRIGWTKHELTRICADDVYLSYLPIAHALERMAIPVVQQFGGKVGFFQGDRLKIMDDLATLRPTIFISVPRLLNRIYDKIIAGVEASGGVKAALFNQALKAKVQNLKEGYLYHSLWDPLVFNKVKGKLGLDRCKIVATGSAPISPDVLDFLRVVLGVPVAEGYGMTELTCIATGADHLDIASSGHVGVPSHCAEVKLVSVPEMGYHYNDTIHGQGENQIECKGRGEIWVRGPCTLLEYYDEPEKTAETKDEDGFVHTGDIGIWLPGGELKIVDRKKNIFKLSQGEYVAPEKIENVSCRSKFVAQAFLYGDSFKSKTVMVAVPDPEILIPWAKAKGLIKDENPNEAMIKLCANKEVISETLKDVERVCKDAKAFSFEIPKAIFLDSEPFSVENKILTNTFKLKRNIAKEHYAKEIDAMYALVSK